MMQHERFVWKLAAGVTWTGIAFLVISGNPVPLIIGICGIVILGWFAAGLTQSHTPAGSETIRTYDEAADAALEEQIERRRRSRKRDQQRRQE